MWQCNIAVNGQLTGFQRKSVVSFTSFWIRCSSKHGKVACLSLTTADIRKRKSLLLEKILETCWMTVFFWKRCTPCREYEGRHIDEKEIKRDNIWIRHLRSFGRNHDVAFDLGIDNMIDEWTRMGDTPELKTSGLPSLPARVSGMLFKTHALSKYVFDNPWIFMQNLSRLQRSDVQYDLKAIQSMSCWICISP
jgi:hypothetical protein